MERKLSYINKRIFDLLDEKGMSQKTLSDLTGISTSAISDWKRKGTNPSAANVRKICKALGVNSEEVFGKIKDDIVDTYEIQRGDELYEFVKFYEGMDTGVRRRILAYAIAMMKAEGES